MASMDSMLQSMVYYFLVIDGELEVPKLLNVCYTFSMNPQVETITRLQFWNLKYFIWRGIVYKLIVTGSAAGQMPSKCFPALPVPVPGLLISLTYAHQAIYVNACKKKYVLTIRTYHQGVPPVSYFNFFNVSEHQNLRCNLPKYHESFLNV